MIFLRASKKICVKTQIFKDVSRQLSRVCLLFLFYRSTIENPFIFKLLSILQAALFPEWLENVIAYFRNPQNYTNNSTLETVYKISGYSKPQFNKLFKKYTSKSPIEYYNESKIESSKFILLENNLSIEHIAY